MKNSPPLTPGTRMDRAEHSASPRRGYSLIELVVSVGAATVLLGGLGSTILITNSGLDAQHSADGQAVDAAIAQRDLMSDLQHALAFSERTPEAVTMIVPDRDGDGAPESIRYAWSGVVGDPLTYEYNAGPPVSIAEDVHQFQLDFLTRAITAPVIPDEEPVSAGRILFVSGGTEVVSDSFFTWGSPTSYVETTGDEEDLILQMTAWGYEVTKVTLDQDSSTIQEALNESDLVYMSSELTTPLLPVGIRATDVGIVSGQPLVLTQLGFSSSYQAAIGRQLVVEDEPHYITADFAPGSILSVLETDGVLNSLSGTIAAEASGLLQTVGGLPRALSTLNPGDESPDGRIIPGRRVHLPWGTPGFDVDNLSSDGLTLLLRSLEWAGGAGDTEEQIFGYDTIFASLGPAFQRQQVGVQVQLPEDGTVTSISAYVGGTDDDVRFALYSDGGGEPADLLAESELGLTGGTMGWLTLDIPDTPCLSGTYWLALSFEDDSQRFTYESTGQTRTNGNRAAQNGFVDPWGTSTGGQSVKFSIYGTYTPSTP